MVVYRRPVLIHTKLVDSTLHDGIPFAITFHGLPKDARCVGADFDQEGDAVRLWFTSTEWDSDSNNGVAILALKSTSEETNAEDTDPLSEELHSEGADRPNPDAGN